MVAEIAGDRSALWSMATWKRPLLGRRSPEPRSRVPLPSGRAFRYLPARARLSSLAGPTLVAPVLGAARHPGERRRVRRLVLRRHARGRPRVPGRRSAPEGPRSARDAGRDEPVHLPMEAGHVRALPRPLAASPGAHPHHLRASSPPLVRAARQRRLRCAADLLVRRRVGGNARRHPRRGARSRSERRARVWFLGIAGFAFIGNWPFRLHAERGQYYVFVALLVAIAFVDLREGRERLRTALVLGVAAGFRPTFAILPLLLFFAGKRRLAITALAIAAALCIATLPLVGVSGWREYFALVRYHQEFDDAAIMRDFGPEIRVPHFAEGLDLWTCLPHNTGNVSFRALYGALCPAPVLPAPRRGARPRGPLQGVRGAVGPDRRRPHLLEHAGGVLDARCPRRRQRAGRSACTSRSRSSSSSR